MWLCIAEGSRRFISSRDCSAWSLFRSRPAGVRRCTQSWPPACRAAVSAFLHRSRSGCARSQRGQFFDMLRSSSCLPPQTAMTVLPKIMPAADSPATSARDAGRRLMAANDAELRCRGGCATIRSRAVAHGEIADYVAPKDDGTAESRTYRGGAAVSDIEAAKPRTAPPDDGRRASTSGAAPASAGASSLQAKEVCGFRRTNAPSTGKLRTTGEGLSATGKSAEKGALPVINSM